MVFSCINDADIDVRRSLYEHVVVSGGSTMYPGLTTRLEKELRQLYLTHVLKGDMGGIRRLRLNVKDDPNRKHTVFKGAAILGEIMAGQPDFWVSRADWAEDPHRALARMGAALV